MTTTTTTTTAVDWRTLVPRIFASCVDPDTTRFDFSRPWTIGDHLYATDGRIILRMPTPATWTIPNSEGRRVNVSELFQGEHHRLQPVPIPAIEGVCPDCQGAQRTTERTCPNCRGRGYEVDADGDAEECEVCDGVGSWLAGTCPSCHGSGVDRSRERIELIPGYWIARRFAVLLRDHGAALYPPVILTHLNTLRFTIGPDGPGQVEGRLAPMTPPGVTP